MHGYNIMNIDVSLQEGAFEIHVDLAAESVRLWISNLKRKLIGLDVGFLEPRTYSSCGR